MRRTRGLAAFALALIAVSLLVFQPICAAGEAHLYDDAESACLSIGPAAPPQSAIPVAFEEPRPAMPAAPAAYNLAGLDVHFCGALASAAALPLPRYHARSARILR